MFRFAFCFIILLLSSCVFSQPNNGVTFINNLPILNVGDSLQHIADGLGSGGFTVSKFGFEGIGNIRIRKFMLVNSAWTEVPTPFYSNGDQGTIDFDEGQMIVIVAKSYIGNNPCPTMSGEDLFNGTSYDGTGSINRTICVASIILPITYSKPLEATQKEKSTHLTWSVATQINNDKYIIENSKDGRYFSTIGEIAGDGTTNETKHYEYIHKSPPFGMNYYRIKQLDYDGKYSYSEIASVRYDGDGETSIYPNPATSEVTISTTEPTSLQIMDVYGRLLLNRDISDRQNTINLSELPTGILIFVVGDQRYKVLKE